MSDSDLQAKKTRMEHVTRRDALRKDGQAALNFLLKEVLITGLVIDSNIWMTQNYEPLFAVLRWLASQGYGARASKRLTIPQVQFDEICLKKASTKYGTRPNMAARSALARIDQLQAGRVFSVKAGYEARPAHGDPALLRLMSSMAGDGLRVCFISDDIEFCIRAREILGKYPAQQWKLLKMDEHILPIANTILAACKVGASPSFHIGLRSFRS